MRFRRTDRLKKLLHPANKNKLNCNCFNALLAAIITFASILAIVFSTRFVSAHNTRYILPMFIFNDSLSMVISATQFSRHSRMRRRENFTSSFVGHYLGAIGAGLPNWRCVSRCYNKCHGIYRQTIVVDLVEQILLGLTFSVTRSKLTHSVTTIISQKLKLRFRNWTSRYDSCRAEQLLVAYTVSVLWIGLLRSPTVERRWTATCASCSCCTPRSFCRSVGLSVCRSARPPSAWVG